MSHKTAHNVWLAAISGRVREREIRRQLVLNRLRKAILAAMRPTDPTSALLAEFLKMLAGSLLGFWIIAQLLGRIAHANQVYVLAGLGLIYALQASYHKFRLSIDPDYKIPKCRCAGSRSDDSETVLRSGEGRVMKIPAPVFGTAFYCAVPALVYADHAAAALMLAVAAVLMSAYLSYAMIVRISGLCRNCINITALNLLVLALLA